MCKHGRRIGVECKRMDALILTASMRIAREDVKLARHLVVYPGERRYLLANRVAVIPLVELAAAGGDPESMFKKRRR